MDIRSMPAPWSSWQEEAAADFCTGKAERLEVARSRVISGLALLRAAMHEAQAEMAVGSTGRASGFNQADEVDGKKETLTVPRRCLNPPCVHLCPWGGGARQYKNGVSRIDYDVCPGGSKCRKLCHWHVFQRQTLGRSRPGKVKSAC